MPKVYVGNLASSVTSSDLLAHFSRAGEALRALAITDRESGLCRGFGFVEMAELADVALAFSLLNNTPLNGQLIKIEPDPVLRKTKRGKVRLLDSSRITFTTMAERSGGELNAGNQLGDTRLHRQDARLVRRARLKTGV